MKWFHSLCMDGKTQFVSICDTVTGWHYWWYSADCRGDAILHKRSNFLSVSDFKRSKIGYQDSKYERCQSDCVFSGGHISQVKKTKGDVTVVFSRQCSRWWCWLSKGGLGAFPTRACPASLAAFKQRRINSVDEQAETLHRNRVSGNS